MAVTLSALIMRGGLHFTMLAGVLFVITARGPAYY